VRWHTIETPHFLVHYHDGLEALGQRTARVAEEAHAILSPLLDWQPGARTHVVVSDFGDDANGLARVVPYNLVQVFAAVPEARSSLGDYDDWLRGLVYHEYTHILHLDTMGGLHLTLNAIFGKSVAPNAALPRWYTEGLATYHESMRTGAGRSRNALYAMILRCAALESRLLSLGTASGAPTLWPGLTAWYLYGAYFVTYLAATRGEEKLRDFNHRYGERWLPLAVNRTAKEVFGQDFVSLWREWQGALLGESLADWVVLRAKGGPTPMRSLTPVAYGHDHVRVHPGQEAISFVHSDGKGARALVLYDLASGATRKVVDAVGSGRHAWAPDGKQLVVARTEVVDRLYAFGDLHWVNAADGAMRPLTRGLRAREPDISPDGRHVVFVVSRVGTSDLMRLDLQTQDLEVLYAGQGLEQLSSPAFSPDGAQVVVSRFVEGPPAQRDLFLFSLEDRRWTRLTDDGAQDVEPIFAPDGLSIIYSADHEGVFDLFRCVLATGQITRISRSIGGTFGPAVARDGRLFATRYGAEGNEIVTFTAPAQEAKVELGGRPRALIRYGDVGVAYPERSYQPWRYLWPRAWFPEFLTTFSLEGALGLTLSGGDPVGRHRWVGNLSYDTYVESAAFSLAYAFVGWPIDLSLGLSHTPQLRRISVDGQGRNYTEDQNRLTLYGGLPFPGSDHWFGFDFGYEVAHFAVRDSLPRAEDPLARSTVLPEGGFFNSLWLSWSFARLKSFAESISTAWGWVVSTSLRLRSPLLGSEYQSFDISAAAQLYLPMPWPDNHVWALRLAGGVGWADYRRRGLYALGGIGEQDLVRTLMEQVGGVGGALLRGYPVAAFWGDHYVLGNLEYRFPLLENNFGYETLPFFVGRLSGALFADYGAAWFGTLRADDLRLGVGGELRLRTHLSYYLPATFRLGYAFGAQRGGLHHVYLVLGNEF